MEVGSHFMLKTVKMTTRVDVPSEVLELFCVEISTLKNKPFLVVGISWEKLLFSLRRKAKKSFSLET